MAWIHNFGFDVSLPGNYTITIHDIYGNKLETLFSGMLEEGRDKFSWKPENIAHGMYFCRITDNRLVKIMTINY